MCVCVHVCTPPSPKITSGVILTLYDWLNNFCCFSVGMHRYQILGLVSAIFGGIGSVSVMV